MKATGESVQAKMMARRKLKVARISRKLIAVMKANDATAVAPAPTPTNGRPFICGDCGRTFAHARNLGRHRAAHRPGRALGPAEKVQARLQERIGILEEVLTFLRATAASVR